MTDTRERLVPARATIVEIARAAGVSTATVDRTLNNRAGVRGHTRERVISVAERLGYLPERPPAGGSRAASVATLDFLLPGGSNTFLRMLAGHLEAMGVSRRHEAAVRVHVIEGLNPEALAAKLTELRSDSNGI